MQTLDRFEVLRIAYDQAFEKLRREVTILNAERPDARVGSLVDLRHRVEIAEAGYRQTRDELAEFLIEKQSSAEEEDYRSPALQGCG